MFPLFQVMPVLELAKAAIKRQGLLPQYLDIKFIPHDDCCEPSLATISVMDGLYGDDCAHAILGPACDYSTGNQLLFGRSSCSTFQTIKVKSK